MEMLHDGLVPVSFILRRHRENIAGDGEVRSSRNRLKSRLALKKKKNSVKLTADIGGLNGFQNFGSRVHERWEPLG